MEGGACLLSPPLTGGASKHDGAIARSEIGARTDKAGCNQLLWLMTATRAGEQAGPCILRRCG